MSGVEIHSVMLLNLGLSFKPKKQLAAYGEHSGFALALIRSQAGGLL